MDKTCKHCKKVFQVEVGRLFSNHVRWCDKNPDRNNNKIAEANSLRCDEKFGQKTTFEVVCAKCNNKFEVIEREKKFPERDVYFCSISCANSRIKSEESKKKVSKALKNRLRTPRVVVCCECCNINFEKLITSKKKFCSSKCFSETRKAADELTTYRIQCSFKFNVWQFPDYFDLDLIRKHGWYKPTNRGNNLNGVSRDHKISVRFGWENNIAPEIIAHPANCQLMIHTDNISKHKKCSIELEQLMENIQAWDEKYCSLD